MIWSHPQGVVSIYTNYQHNFYTSELATTFTVMQTVKVKKVRSEKPFAKNEVKVELPQGDESFNQTTKQDDVVCFCCGKPGEYVSDCKVQKEIAEKIGSALQERNII